MRVVGKTKCVKKDHVCALCGFLFIIVQHKLIHAHTIAPSLSSDTVQHCGAVIVA